MRSRCITKKFDQEKLMIVTLLSFFFTALVFCISKVFVASPVLTKILTNSHERIILNSLMEIH